MSTPTSGPWRVSNPQSSECALVITDDATIARAYVGDKAPAIANANAHLIAAAPDLLAALKALTVLSLNGSQLCFRTKNGIPMGMSKKQERLARAAIAKAEGKGQAA